MRRILLSILILMAMIPVSNARTLRILSFNIREWTRDLDAKGEYYWRDRMEAMTKMLEDMDPDVICLQEVLPPAGRYVPEGYRRVGIGVSHPIYHPHLLVLNQLLSIFVGSNREDNER